jgi:hypothetical protein
MELVMYSIIGQTEPNITIKQHLAPNFTMTTYRFVDKNGVVLEVRLYEHPAMPITPAIVTPPAP